MDFFDPRTDLDITGLEWWEVLQRLHRATKAIGPFALNDRPLSAEHAMGFICAYNAQRPRQGFELINARPMKISFHTRYGQSWVRGVDLYDRDSLTPGRVTIAKLRNEKYLELCRREN